VSEGKEQRQKGRRKGQRKRSRMQGGKARGKEHTRREKSTHRDAITLERSEEASIHRGTITER
jgi:hypothetical protein